MAGSSTGFSDGAAARRGVIVVVVLAAVAAIAACAPEPTTSTRQGYITFAPSAVSADNTLSNEKVSFAGSPTEAARNRLVVLLAGTNGTPTSMSVLGDYLISEGYHVLGLSYANAFGTAHACPDSERDVDPDCHRRFRGEVVFGENVPDPNGDSHDHHRPTVGAANSVKGSLIAHLHYAHSRLPEWGWDHFLHLEDGICVQEAPTYAGCEPRWDSISLMGFSQGGGVALYLAKFHTVAAVGMLSAPADVYGPVGDPRVAPWIADGQFATPASRIATLNHTAENERWRYQLVADSLGLTGPEVDIRQTPAPYGGSARLTSSVEPECLLLDPQAYHHSTALNSCTRRSAYAPAWLHLAG